MAALDPGPAHDRGADVDAGLGPDGGHPAGPFVAEDRVGGAPAVEHHVQVGAAHPAVGHLHQRVARPERGHRRVGDLQLSRPPIDGGSHGVGHCVHAPVLCMASIMWVMAFELRCDAIRRLRHWIGVATCIIRRSSIVIDSGKKRDDSPSGPSADIDAGL